MKHNSTFIKFEEAEVFKFYIYKTTVKPVLSPFPKNCFREKVAQI